jgi:2-methylcitrate dehydratase PrpD
MDDTHQGGSIHLGATMFSAGLAAAEMVGASGARVLAAVAAGYQVAARLAMALDPAAHYERGFHPTGTCGAFGAAITAGLLFGLDRGGLTAALGIAGSQAAGSMEFLATGAWTKRLHPGWAACAGLHAAALAEAGFLAPDTIVDGRFGFLHAYSGGSTLAALERVEGWEICRTAVKPHACCRYMQGPIDAALALRAAHRIDQAAIERIDVGMLAAGFAIVCEPSEAKRRPVSDVDLQFSLPFGVAVALVRGRASVDDFRPSTLADPGIGKLLDRVHAVRDPGLDAVFPREWPAWVRILLRDGTRLETRIDRPLGDPENFPTPEARRAKLHQLAGRTLSPAALPRLATAIDGFRAATNVTPLMAAAVPTVT